MYTGNLSLLRLTELHEEWAHHAFAAHDAGRDGHDEASDRYQREADRIDAEIRARVAIQQPPGPNGPEPRRAGCALAAVSGGVIFWGGVPLKHGVPDAARAYPSRRANPLAGWPVEHYPAHWTTHARHALPVEGCHLCQDAPRGPGSFNGGLSP